MSEINFARASDVLELEAETGRLFWRCGSNIRKTGEAGYIAPSGYRIVMLDGKNHRAHRLVWLLTNGVLPTADIDHVNGIRSDNRPSNLREATRSENNQNQRLPRSSSKSPYLGVTWDAPTNKWRAQIALNRRRKYLGLHLTPEDAHAAYVQAKRRLHSHGML